MEVPLRVPISCEGAWWFAKVVKSGQIFIDRKCLEDFYVPAIARKCSNTQLGVVESSQRRVKPCDTNKMLANCSNGVKV
jgi:hypothetical protein